MKKILSVVAFTLCSMSVNAMAANYFETNSLVVCDSSAKLSDAVDAINLTISSPEYSQLNSAGNYMHIKDYTASEPVITAIAPTSTSSGGYAVCVTLTRKSSWLANK